MLEVLFSTFLSKPNLIDLESRALDQNEVFTSSSGRGRVFIVIGSFIMIGVMAKIGILAFHPKICFLVVIEFSFF